ncbi:hypothetical protein SAMN05216285_2888 [Natrinema salifodinae]|uniref:Uncharacterized protein n=1 Tax=Natrinema salifodinae TaxID=1202768 RepID=A0A1I0PSM9_9EURY|nr:hypothetical protein SAMN05216285_2888 [Natrinema salifodinae]
MYALTPTGTTVLDDFFEGKIGDYQNSSDNSWYSGQVPMAVISHMCRNRQEKHSW